jgi:N-acetylmuramoyl-L-alanine amidase
VRDVQERLAALGHLPDGDPDSVFGPSTRAAVEAFQRHRGLRNDGIVTQSTWDRLVEAGRRLGDRVLSTTAPLLRGDDVAELQERLAALGFDPGRVDGIYGARTRAAVAGFQRDAGLPADGMAGPATVVELRRLAARHPGSMLVNEVKERATRQPRSLDTLVVAVGQAGGLDAVVEASARALRERGATPVVVREPDEGPIAASANVSTARCLVVVRLDPGAAAATGLFFSTDRSESPSGHRLAESLAEHAARALGVTAATRGMALTVLRESRMPASVLELGPLDLVVERTAELADAVATAVEGWARQAAESS